MGFAKKVKSFFKKKKLKIPASDPRAQAAEQLVRENVKRQAGAGQISFTEERRV